MKRPCYMLNRLFVILICLAAMGCHSGSGSNSESDATMEVERFDRASGSFGSLDRQGRDSVEARYGEVISFMGRLTGLSSADSVMDALASSQAVRVFQPDIESRLPDLSEIECQLGVARERAAVQMPGMSFPRRVVGIVSPYEQSVVVVDTIVLVGLNHYLGADYEGYNGFDDYRRRLKESDRMAYDVVEAAVRTSYPYEGDGHSTVASRLGYEGAVAVAVERLIPGSSAASGLGYSDDQMSAAEGDEQMIWRYLASDGRLYSIDQTMAERLVAPAPYSMIGGVKVSARIGRFVGYRLVDSYLRNNSEATVDGILSSRLYSADDFVVRSGYVGR